jgi:hypothetical protein
MGSRPGFPTPFDVRKPLVVLAVVAAVLGPVLATLWVSTPDVSDAQARVVSDTRAHGVVVLAPNAVPDVLAKAVVATEDERFYSHHGIDTIGLARAVLYDTANVCFCQGGSTITEQLVKELYLNGSDRGYDKVVDIVLALKLERLLNKSQIMADYLSEIPTGPQPVRCDRRRVRLFPCAAGQPQRGAVRTAGRSDPGAVDLRPHGEPGRRQEPACPGAFCDGVGSRHHQRAG